MCHISSFVSHRQSFSRHAESSPFFPPCRILSFFLGISLLSLGRAEGVKRGTLKAATLDPSRYSTPHAYLFLPTPLAPIPRRSHACPTPTPRLPHACPTPAPRLPHAYPSQPPHPTPTAAPRPGRFREGSSRLLKQTPCQPPNPQPPPPQYPPHPNSRPHPDPTPPPSGARGLDVPHCSHVFLFDLPESADDYVHAAGRCGRAGRRGSVTTFCAKEGFGP